MFCLIVCFAEARDEVVKAIECLNEYKKSLPDGELFDSLSSELNRRIQYAKDEYRACTERHANVVLPPDGLDLNALEKAELNGQLGFDALKELCELTQNDAMLPFIQKAATGVVRRLEMLASGGDDEMKTPDPGLFKIVRV